MVKNADDSGVTLVAMADGQKDINLGMHVSKATLFYFCRYACDLPKTRISCLMVVMRCVLPADNEKTHGF